MRFLLFLPVGALLLAGCATTPVAPNVQVNSVNPAAVLASSSYAWVPDRSGMSTNPLNNADVWRGVVRTAVDRELTSRGYRKTSMQGAGYVIAYHFVVRNGGMVTVVDNYYGYDAPGIRVPLDTFVKAHTPTREGEGTLVVDAVDPVAKKLLWRGWVTTHLKGLLGEERHTAIDGLVATALKDFPARSR